MGIYHIQRVWISVERKIIYKENSAFRSGRYYVVRDSMREIYYFSKKSMKSVGNLGFFAYKLKLY